MRKEQEFVVDKGTHLETKPVCLVTSGGNVFLDPVIIEIRGGIISAIRRYRGPYNIRFLTAGLGDAHVHTFMDGSESLIRMRTVMQERPKEALEIALANAHSYLKIGVTQYIDQGPPIPGVGNFYGLLLEEAKRKNILLPEIIFAPVTVGVKNGFASDACSMLSRETLPDILHNITGADGTILKLIGECGYPSYMTPLSEEFLTAVLETACLNGLAVHMHAKGKVLLQRAIRCTVRQGVRRWVSCLHHCVEAGCEDLKDMERKGIFFAPTLFGLQKRYHRSLDTGEGTLAAVYERENSIRVAKEAASLNDGRPMQNLVVGSDGGSASTEHPATIQEMLELVRQGLNPASALQAATWNIARLLGQTSEIGIVNVGFKARLVWYDENPLQALHEKRLIAPAAVMLDGKILVN